MAHFRKLRILNGIDIDWICYRTKLWIDSDWRNAGQQRLWNCNETKWEFDLISCLIMFHSQTCFFPINIWKSEFFESLYTRNPLHFYITDSPYRTMMNSAVLKLQEEGKLHILKTRWWKEKRGGGSCRVWIYYNINMNFISFNNR